MVGHTVYKTKRLLVVLSNGWLGSSDWLRLMTTHWT